MAFLTKAQLTPPLYAEIIETITRGDDAIVTTAINNAVKEMSSYLNRFDKQAIFGYTGEDNNFVEPTFTDAYLLSLAKDITAWHLIKLSNPNIDLELFRTSYKDAIEVLIRIMKGQLDPEWPLKKDPDQHFDTSGHYSLISNTKRNNHF